MTDFHILKEDPEGSGTFKLLDDKFTGHISEAVDFVVDKTHAGQGRHAIFIAEPMRKDTAGAPIHDPQPPQPEPTPAAEA